MDIMQWKLFTNLHKKLLQSKKFTRKSPKKLIRKHIKRNTKAKQMFTVQIN